MIRGRSRSVCLLIAGPGSRARGNGRVVCGHGTGDGHSRDRLAGIGSTQEQATTAAADPTTGIATAAADEASIAVSQLFGTYGREFQAVSTEAAEFHFEFVRLLNGGAAPYLSTEIANTERSLLDTVPLTATISLPSYPPPPLGPGPPTDVTVFGTPFSGLVPLLVNGIPEQLAAAIKLTA